MTTHQDATPRTFEFLLNAMENAAHHTNPADHFYGDKRAAVLAYVAELEALRARLASVEMPREDTHLKTDARLTYGEDAGTVINAYRTALQAALVRVADLENVLMRLRGEVK